ncbi:MAG: phage holin family protein [Steroidobacteraceae bacterium]
MLSPTSLLATLLGLLQTRLELAATEIEEQAARILRMVFWAVLGLLAAALGLLLAIFWLIVAFWEDHRLLVIGLATGLCLVIGLGSARGARAGLRRRPGLLAGSSEELQRDRDALGPPP